MNACGNFGRNRGRRMKKLKIYKGPLFGFTLSILLLSGCGHEIGDKFILKKDIAGANSIDDFKTAIKDINEKGSEADIMSYTKQFPEGDEIEIMDVQKDMCLIKDLDNDVNGDMWTTCNSL